jgi:hypothetical protein
MGSAHTILYPNLLGTKGYAAAAAAAATSDLGLHVYSRLVCCCWHAIHIESLVQLHRSFTVAEFCHEILVEQSLPLSQTSSSSAHLQTICPKGGRGL